MDMGEFFMAKTKVNMIGSKSVFIKYIVKVLLLSVLTVILLSSFFAFIVVKLDLSLDFSKYFSIFAVGLSSVIVSYFSVGSFSNNGAVLGIISVMPLGIYSLINNFIYTNDWLILLIKLALIIILSAFFGNLSIKKRKKIRVK